MGIQAIIVAINQRVDLATQVASNTAEILLPNGKRLQVGLSNHQMKDVFEAMAAQATGDTHSTAVEGLSVESAPAAASTPTINSDGSTLFGGGSEEEDVAPSANAVAVIAETPMVLSAPRVVNDGNGYPMRVDGVDPAQVVGRGNGQYADEDGVGSV